MTASRPRRSRHDGAGGRALPVAAAHGARRPRAAVLRRRVRHLRPRQRRRHRRRRCRPSAARCRYYLARNEQAMVHTAAAYAKMHNRLRDARLHHARSAPARPTWSPARRARRSTGCRCCCCRATSSPAGVPRRCCSSSSRSQSQDVSVNDCFKPVSRYWDRINRPEQILTALPEAMRVLTSPAETGAVTLALPQDVQAEALRLSGGAVRAARVDHRTAARGSRRCCSEAARLIRAQPAAADRRRRRRDLQRGDRGARGASSTRPASPSARRRPARARCPIHPLSLGGVGATGTPRRQPARARRRPGDRRRLAAAATSPPRRRPRFSTPACGSSRSTSPSSTRSSTAALPLVGDARAALEELAAAASPAIASARTTREAVAASQTAWSAEVDRVYAASRPVAVRSPDRSPAQARSSACCNDVAGAAPT